MANVDDYLDQLEAALKARETASAVRETPREPGEEAVTTPPTVMPAAPVPAPEPSLVAEAFAALLALEDGEPGAKPVRLVMGTADPRLTDAFISEVARRVAERLKSE